MYGTARQLLIAVHAVLTGDHCPLDYGRRHQEVFHGDDISRCRQIVRNAIPGDKSRSINRPFRRLTVSQKKAAPDMPPGFTMRCATGRLERRRCLSDDRGVDAAIKTQLWNCAKTAKMAQFGFDQVRRIQNIDPVPAILDHARTIRWASTAERFSPTRPISHIHLIFVNPARPLMMPGVTIVCPGTGTLVPSSASLQRGNLLLADRSLF